MISGNVVNIKHFFKKNMGQKFSKKSGFSLIEVLIASAIASIILVSTIIVVSNIYQSSKRIAFTQNFYSESRNLMTRISRIARENTIDYDRYFEESGPDCGGLDSDQGQGSYKNVFFWDLDGDGEVDRNLFGFKPDGTTDSCTKAWHENASEQILKKSSTDILPLYLINGARNKRFTIAFDGTNKTLSLSTEMGTDTDGDGEADVWSFMQDSGAGLRINASGVCVYDDGAGGTQIRVLAEATQENCISSHAPVVISTTEMQINDFSYKISPDRDPFLSTRIDSAMQHPFIRFFIDLELQNPESYGFDSNNKPQVKLQAAVSSRVYGNTRK
jgi:prepilin-type N-terminal cleavage/methylation domain-containing protein